mgnify:CR=1 FL=1
MVPRLDSENFLQYWFFFSVLEPADVYLPMEEESETHILGDLNGKKHNQVKFTTGFKVSNVIPEHSNSRNMGYLEKSIKPKWVTNDNSGSG